MVKCVCGNGVKDALEALFSLLRSSLHGLWIDVFVFVCVFIVVYFYLFQMKINNHLYSVGSDS